MSATTDQPDHIAYDWDKAADQHRRWSRRYYRWAAKAERNAQHAQDMIGFWERMGHHDEDGRNLATWRKIYDSELGRPTRYRKLARSEAQLARQCAANAAERRAAA